MATLKQWYEQLPSPVREQAISNAILQSKDLNSDCSRNLFHALNQIHWAETLEGHEYWSDITMYCDGSVTDDERDRLILKIVEDYKETIEKYKAFKESLKDLDVESLMEPRRALDWFYTLDEPFRYNLMNLHANQGHRFHVRYDSMYDLMCEVSLGDEPELREKRREYKIIDEYVRRKKIEIQEARAQARRERIEANRLTFSTSFKEMLGSLNCRVATLLRSEEYHDNSFCNYITMRGLMASYLPAGREHKTNSETGKWLRDGRQEMKIGKLARKLLYEAELKQYNIELNDQHFEEFGNEVKAYISINGDEDGEGKNITLEVVEGEDIRKCYHGNNYSGLQGTDTNLWQSCMRYDNCQKYLDIFVHNPEVCKLLVAKDCDGKVLGRALLWEEKCMDTIYAHESIRKAFINWAKENNYRYKSQQSCHHHLFDLPISDDSSDYLLEVELKRYNFDYYPYMDTMRFLDGHILHNDSDGSWDYELRHTDGRRSEDDDGRIYCDWHGESYDEEDVRYVNYTRPNGRRIESYVHYEDVVELSNGDYVLEEDAVEATNGCWYLKNDDRINFSDRDDSYYHEDDCTYLSYISDYAHNNDCEVCEHDGECYLKDDMQQIDDAEGDKVWVYNENVEEYLESIKTEEDAQ